MQPTGGSAADLTSHELDYTAAVDTCDLESVLSGASQVSWTSFVDWAVDKLIAEVEC